MIISLELHLNLEQQEIMVDIMREIWGDMLLDKAIGQNQDDDVPLVSPDELRGKILVKVKHVTEKVLDENAGSASLPAAQRVTSVSSSGSDVEVSGKDAAKKPKPIKVIEALSKLGVYTRSYHFSTFSQPGKSSIKDLWIVCLTQKDRGFDTDTRLFSFRKDPHGHA